MSPSLDISPSFAPTSLCPGLVYGAKTSLDKSYAAGLLVSLSLWDSQATTRDSRMCSRPRNSLAPNPVSEQNTSFWHIFPHVFLWIKHTTYNTFISELEVTLAGLLDGDSLAAPPCFQSVCSPLRVARFAHSNSLQWCKYKFISQRNVHCFKTLAITNTDTFRKTVYLGGN